MKLETRNFNSQDVENCDKLAELLQQIVSLISLYFKEF